MMAKRIAPPSKRSDSPRGGKLPPVPPNRAKSSAADPLARLLTEQINPRATGIDRKSSLEIVRLINAEDQTVPRAVARVLPQVAKAVDLIVDSLDRGGRLIYVGAGTSGRLGVLDASECPPTFNSPPEQVLGIIAGGARALQAASEISEDDPRNGARDLRGLRVNARDTVVGLAASGRTPYTIGAIQYARSRGAHTVAVACVRGSALAAAAELAITPLTGPEVVSGSTRMKAGTAQKLVLNMLSTAAMIRTGHVLGPYMIHVQPRNYKLENRSVRILRAITAAGEQAASERLRECGGDLQLAIAVSLTGLSVAQARKRLARSRLREVIGKSEAAARL